MVDRRMLIAGGGTGGHLFPGLAVAREFLDRDPEHRVLFVGTGQGIEARAVPAAGFPFAAIPSRGIAGKGAIEKLRGLLTIPRSLLAAAGAVRSFRPLLALGVGGYVSGAAILAARMMGVVCAVHEQNAAPGYTNRLLARFSQAVFVSFEEAESAFPGPADKGRVLVLGNPVRKPILEALLKAGDKTAERSPDRVSILVMGGSQGAAGLNRLFLEALRETPGPRRNQLKVIHQSGERDLEEVRAHYRELGMEARVQAFIEDMAAAYLEADLVVSRAGAGAVAEIALAGLPSILVPYPFAAADHQAMNAQALVRAGAALMFREDGTEPRQLARALDGLIESPAERLRMAAAARGAARPDAAKDIVDHCLELMTKEARPARRGRSDGER